MEARQLLATTVFGGKLVSFDHATYVVKLAGPGKVSVGSVGKAGVAINLVGSTGGSSLSIRRIAATSAYDGSLLPVARINVASGAIGQVLGSGAVDLLGTFAARNPISTIQIGAVGPAAKIIASGGLGSLSVDGAIDLGPKGLISVGGDLQDPLRAGTIDLMGGKIAIGQDLGGLATASLVVGAGGQFVVGQNLAGLTASSLAVGPGGQFLVGQNSGPIVVTGNASIAGGSFLTDGNAGSLNVGGNLSLSGGGRLAVGRDFAGTLTVGGSLSIDAGQVSVARDFIGSASINGDLSASDGGNLAVGRDLTGSLVVGGNLLLSTAGAVVIGRTIGADAGGAPGLSVGGNLTTGVGSVVSVGGDLDGLQVGGVILGAGTDSGGLVVGLDLNNWSVNGGAPNSGGVANFNVDVGKDITGITILHGLFNDFITAGVLITNVSVGADGPVAVFDTEIRSGLTITNVAIGGDVKSDRPTNMNGRRTRIIAGEDRLGAFEIGGTIDNLVIAGSLIDSAVVASVQPYGGDGSGTVTVTPAPLPPVGALDYYDAPGGGAFRAYGNLGKFYSAPPFDGATDGTLHDTVLPGGINRSFAPTKATAPFPTQSTVLGSVITTAHANMSDYAGFFAADTGSIFVGPIPG